jgi:L-threonylcarbamoyladenylate synthase
MINSKEKKIIEILKNGGVEVIPTDTIYGIVGSAFSKQAVERIYKIKNRPDNSPFIILISSLKDLENFNIKINKEQAKILEKFWPGKVSIIFPCNLVKYKYLHRGTKSLAFRFPNKKSLIEIIKKTGPLVAPSANLSNEKPAENINEARKYFGDSVDFYLSGGTLKSKPSALIRLGNDSEIIILRGNINL